MEPWPAERMKRSRSAQWGLAGSNFITLVKRTVAISAQPMGRPGCPELAFSTASIDSDRIALAKSFCWVVFVIGKPLSFIKEGWRNWEEEASRPPPKGAVEASQVRPLCQCQR